MCATKTCTRCGEDKPATLEYFYQNYGTPRLQAWCISCDLKRKKAHREKHKKQKRCPECNVLFTPSVSNRRYCKAHSSSSKNPTNQKHTISYVKKLITKQSDIAKEEVTLEQVALKYKELCLIRRLKQATSSLKE